MALSLYVLCVASFACVYGHRLALQGPHGSLERAVHMLKEYRYHFFAMAGGSLFCLVCAAVLMAWIKMGAAASVVTGIFIAFFWFVASRLNEMHQKFQIKGSEVVTGAARIQAGDTAIDLARLNPRHQASSQASYARMEETRDDDDDVDDRSSAQTRGKTSMVGQFASNMATSVTDMFKAPQAQSSQADRNASRVLEGYLMKLGKGTMVGKPTFKSRYFVLQRGRLYYFHAWEDYGATGINAAINFKEPILMYKYQAQAVRFNAEQFHLVSTENPLDRKWDLKASTREEASEWVAALNSVHEAMAAARGPSNASLSRPHDVVNTGE